MTEITIDRIVELAKAWLFENGEHPPALWLQSGDGQLTFAMIADLADTFEWRRSQLYTFGRRYALQASGLKRVFFVSEAWMSRIDEDDYGAGNYTMPSRDPQRIEILVVASLEYPSCEADARMRAMLRDSAGALIGLKALHTTDAGSAESALLAAFADGYGDQKRKEN